MNWIGSAILHAWPAGNNGCGQAVIQTPNFSSDGIKANKDRRLNQFSRSKLIWVGLNSNLIPLMWTVRCLNRAKLWDEQEYNKLLRFIDISAACSWLFYRSMQRIPCWSLRETAEKQCSITLGSETRECLSPCRVFFGGETVSPCFDLFWQLADKTIIKFMFKVWQKSV